MNPIAALLILPIVWIAATAGRRANRMACPSIDDPSILALERTCFGLAAGYILLALGILALGLLRLLSVVPIALWLAALAVFAAKEHRALAVEIAENLPARSLSKRKTFFWSIIALIALGALGGCFVPPVSSEWDSLSYHLADPKLYAAAHYIFYIPWESHSNFAFNMEMLYSIGMLARSIALAKLFHFVIGIAGAAGVFLLARRIIPPERGMRNAPYLALAVYATLPLVFWEAGTAYVDLAATSYAALALLAMAIAVQTKQPRFYLIAGILLGGMLGIKATAVITIALYAIGIVLYAQMQRLSLRPAFLNALRMSILAAIIGSPWYIKSWIYTGNPVYPFAYSLFGGRYWNKTSTIAYNAAQYNFGVGHKLSDLLLVPWNLTMYLVPGHIAPQGFSQPFNDYQTLSSSLSPLFLFCALAALAIPLAAPRGIKMLTGYCIAALIIWFFLTQQVRYVLPIAPVLCVLSAWAILRLSAQSAALRWAAWIASAAALGFNLAAIGVQAGANWHVALELASAQQQYIAAGLNSYPAMQFINTQTPLDAKVICYNEPRTLYLNRAHMWGDSGVDPTYPPYASLGTPQNLKDWLTARGYRYILINNAFAPLTPTNGWAGMVYALTFGSASPPIYADASRKVYVFQLN